jgi:aspartate aminotransferase
MNPGQCPFAKFLKGETMSFLSHRASQIKPSATLSLTAKANVLKKEGRPVISFAAGEPDFDSPDVVKAAGRLAIAEGRTKYAPVSGYQELREEITIDLQKMTGIKRSAEEVLVSCGAKHVLYNLIQATVNPGDKVVFAAPYWVSYPAMVDLAGGHSEVIQTTAADKFRLAPEQLDETLKSSGAKVVIINSPQNPTGVVYSPEDIDALVDACIRNKALLISDEIYSSLIYGGQRHRSAAAIDGPLRRAHVVVVNGVSKTYSMTGWRIGYAVGPKDIMNAAKNIQSHSTSGASSISQFAALHGLRAGVDCVSHMLKAFKERRELIARLLDAIPHVHLVSPQGAFYAFPEVSYYCRGYLADTKIESDFDLAGALLEQADIAVVPGTPFGSPGHLRLSFALGLEDIREGLDRMTRILASWRAP